MKNFIIALTFILFGYFSYYMGAKNQWYYDAPAKIKLYQFIINSNELRKKTILDNMIMKERCVLATKNQKVNLMMYHPVHSGVRDLFFEYIDTVCKDEKCGCNSNATIKDTPTY